MKPHEKLTLSANYMVHLPALLTDRGHKIPFTGTGRRQANVNPTVSTQSTVDVENTMWPNITESLTSFVAFDWAWKSRWAVKQIFMAHK